MSGHETSESFRPRLRALERPAGRGFPPKPFYSCAPSALSTMSLLDVFRQECVNGKVVDKYRLENGNLGLVVKDSATRRRYHVEFRDNYKGPSSENLFGLLKEPFAGKTEYLDKLVEAGDSIGLTLSYSRGPFREAYYVHSVSRSEPRRVPYGSLSKLIELPYREDGKGGD